MKPYSWQTLSMSRAARQVRDMAMLQDAGKRAGKVPAIIALLENADASLAERRGIIERHEKALFLLALVEELGVKFIHDGTEAIIGDPEGAVVMNLDELKIEKAP